MVNTRRELRAKTPNRINMWKLEVFLKNRNKYPQSKQQMLSNPKKRAKGQKDPIQVPLPELEVFTVH